MKLGTLTFTPAANSLELVSDSVKALAAIEPDILVAKIDPALSDTAAFCEHYGIGMDQSANCVIVEAKRADKVWYAACVILATTKADINGIVKRRLEARKTSFAPMDKAVTMTGMEYGGITPIGLPKGLPVLIDIRVAKARQVIIGSGVRNSKLLVPPALLAKLPDALVIDLVK